jgi:hypothetical protein
VSKLKVFAVCFVVGMALALAEQGISPLLREKSRAKRRENPEYRRIKERINEVTDEAADQGAFKTEATSECYHASVGKLLGQAMVSLNDYVETGAEVFLRVANGDVEEAMALMTSVPAA